MVCIIVNNKEDVAAFKDYVPSPEDDVKIGGSGAPAAVKQPEPAAPPPPAPLPPTAVSPPTVAPPAASGARVFATPFAKTLASEKGIDLKVSATEK